MDVDSGGCRRFSLALGGAALAIVVQCTPFGSAPGPDGVVSGPGVGLDAAASDGEAEAAVGADPHVGPNLIANGAFESGCAPWTTFQGAITSEPIGRTGSKSCRVCTLPGTPDYFTAGDGYTAPAPVVNSSYHLVLWVRTAPGAPAPPGIYLHIRSSNKSPFTSVESASTPDPGIPIDATWQKLELTMKATQPAEQMDVFLGSNTAPNVCFLVDDVWFERLPSS